MNKNDAALSIKRRNQPHNAYNIFFMLERYLLVQETGRLSGIEAADQNQQPSYDLAGYKCINLPDLPPRFCSLILPRGWFVPGKNVKRKRKHVKTHGGESLSFAVN
jgi:hypothetical protein